MRVRVFLLISVVLNVALVVAFFGWMKSTPRNGERFVRPVNVAVVNSNILRIIKTNVLVRPRLFTWQEVEAPDYLTYVQNLRGLGMPESIIRDIIIADVDQIFGQRRREELSALDTEWWRAQPSAEYQSNSLVRSDSLEAERGALLTRLLGGNWREGRIDLQSEPLALAGPVLGALADDVKKSVRDIAARSGQRAGDYIAQMQAQGQEPDAVQLARLREETRQQLAQVLNPQQLEEFLLRYSSNASQLRSQLAGLDVSPEEFRAIFRATDAIDRDLQLRFAGNDPESQRQRAALEQQRAAAMQGALGSERFEAFQMMRDPAYQEALLMAERGGVTQEAAVSLYEISKATADELDRIRKDSTLTEAQKRQAILDTEEEQQRARALVLGELPAVENPASVAPPHAAAPPFHIHAKEPGETAWHMSFRFHVSISQIKEANPGLDINRLPAGTSINIPAPTVPPTRPTRPARR